MKNDFTGYSPEQLNGVLKFTEALANQLPQGLNTASMTAGDASDDDAAVEQGRAYAAAKNSGKRNIRSRINETEDDISLRESIRGWLRRCRNQKTK
jgi:hypothetical protein